MTDVIDATSEILREIQRQLKAALENAQRDRELAHRAVSRVDRFEARFDGIAADIRNQFDSLGADIRDIRSDIASIDIKLAALPMIETAVAHLETSLEIHIADILTRLDDSVTKATDDGP